MCVYVYTSNDLRATTCTNGKVFCFLSIVTRSIVFVFTVHKGVCAFSREGAGKVAGTALTSSLKSMNEIKRRVSTRRATITLPGSASIRRATSAIVRPPTTTLPGLASIRRATSSGRVSPATSPSSVSIQRKSSPAALPKEIDFKSTSRAGTANATSGRPMMMMVIQPSGGHQGAPL